MKTNKEGQKRRQEEEQEEEDKGIQRNTKEVQTATAVLGQTRLPVQLHTTTTLRVREQV